MAGGLASGEEAADACSRALAQAGLHALSAASAQRKKLALLHRQAAKQREETVQKAKSSSSSPGEATGRSW